jgi:hypothetical protein
MMLCLAPSQHSLHLANTCHVPPLSQALGVNSCCHGADLPVDTHVGDPLLLCEYMFASFLETFQKTYSQAAFRSCNYKAMTHFSYILMGFIMTFSYIYNVLWSYSPPLYYFLLSPLPFTLIFLLHVFFFFHNLDFTYEETSNICLSGSGLLPLTW